MRIGVDIDNTIRQFQEDAIYKYNVEFGYSDKKLTMDMCFDYNAFYSLLGGRDRAFDWWIKNEVFLHAPVISGARESLLELSNRGHDIVLISKQTRHSHPEAARQTTQWLYNNRIVYDELHYCDNKNFVDVDILIDDNGKIMQKFLEWNQLKGTEKDKFGILLIYPWTNESLCYNMGGTHYFARDPYWKNIMKILEDKYEIFRR